jgi:hypothetical protein
MIGRDKYFINGSRNGVFDCFELGYIWFSLIAVLIGPSEFQNLYEKVSICRNATCSAIGLKIRLPLTVKINDYGMI